MYIVCAQIISFQIHIEMSVAGAQGDQTST